MSRSRGDAGYTLAELMVAVTLMGFCALIVTPAVVHVFDTVRRMEAVTTAQSRLRVALQRLDKEIRYASEISAARHVGDDWYVEYRGDGAAGQAVCSRLRLSPDGTLQQLRWTERAFDAARPWTPLAYGVAPQDEDTDASASSSSAPPFQRLRALDAGADRLRIRLVVTEGGSAFAADTAVDFTFTAMNSLGEDEATVQGTEPCQEGQQS